MANITPEQQAIVKNIGMLKAVNKQMKKVSMIKKAELAMISMEITAEVLSLLAIEVIADGE